MDASKNDVVVFVQQKPGAKLQSFVNKIVSGGLVASVGSTAFAATTNYDTSDVIANIGGAVSAAAVIGVAWLGFTAGIAIWRNLRAAAR